MKKIITSVLSDAGIRAFFDIEYLDDGTISLSNYTGNYTDIKIPKKYKGTKITKIGEDAFEDCTSLTTVDCRNVETIGVEAFRHCTSLTTVIFGSSLETIAYGAFYNCPSLESFEVDENNPNFCSEDGVLFNKDKTKLICYPAGKKETSYTVPESVETIDYGAFKHCDSLTTVDCSSAKTIGGYAFYGCESLTKITCPNVTSIGEDAFEGCTSLKNVPTEKCPNS